MIDDEVWLRIPLPGLSLYRVSNLGRIRRLAYTDNLGRFWKERFVRATNAEAKLFQNKTRTEVYHPVGRLVLLAFVGSPPSPEKCMARHLDDNRGHNYVSNLAWGDHKDNGIDAARNNCFSHERNNEFKEACRQRMLGNTMNRGRKHKPEIHEACRQRMLGKKDSSKTKNRKSVSAKKAWARRKAETQNANL